MNFINFVKDVDALEFTNPKDKTFPGYSNTVNLFAKHPEVDLKKEIKSLNIGDNRKLVGKEDVWKTN